MPVRWPIEVGEFVHNLRSALDHLVWQLAVAHRDCAGLRAGDACPGRHNRFPIHDIPGGWRGVRLHWSLEDLLPRLLELPKEYDLHPRLNSRFIAREVAVLSQGALRAAPRRRRSRWPGPGAGPLALQHGDTVTIDVTIAAPAGAGGDRPEPAHRAPHTDQGGNLRPAPSASTQAPGQATAGAPGWDAGANRRQFPPVAGR